MFSKIFKKEKKIKSDSEKQLNFEVELTAAVLA